MNSRRCGSAARFGLAHRAGRRRDRLDVEDRAEDTDRGHAVDERVVDLGDHRGPTVGEALDHRELPQRAIPRQWRAADLPHQRGQALRGRALGKDTGYTWASGSTSVGIQWGCDTPPMPVDHAARPGRRRWRCARRARRRTSASKPSGASAGSRMATPTTCKCCSASRGARARGIDAGDRPQRLPVGNVGTGVHRPIVGPDCKGPGPRWSGGSEPQPTGQQIVDDFGGLPAFPARHHGG